MLLNAASGARGTWLLPTNIFIRLGNKSENPYKLSRCLGSLSCLSTSVRPSKCRLSLVRPELLSRSQLLNPSQLLPAELGLSLAGAVKLLPRLSPSHKLYNILTLQICTNTNDLVGTTKTARKKNSVVFLLIATRTVSTQGLNYVGWMTAGELFTASRTSSERPL